MIRGHSAIPYSEFFGPGESEVPPNVDFEAAFTLYRK